MKKILLFSLVLTMLLKASAQQGMLDSSFGTNGIVNLGSTSGYGAFRSDGKLLIGGTLYNTDGSVDSSYGTNGTIIPVGTNSIRAFQPDGKLVVEGDTNVLIFPTTYHYFLFTRYNLNGTVDNSFYGGQLKVLESSRNPTDQDRSGELQSLFISNSNQLAYVVRYHDTGGNYYRIFRFIGSSQLNFYGTLNSFRAPIPYALAFTNDNKLIAGGYEFGTLPGTTQSLQRGLLERYNSNGTLDSSFGVNGIVEQPGQAITRIVVQGDLKILASQSGINLLRFNANGTMDATFNGNGVVITPFTFNKMVTTNDGKIIIGGILNDNFAIARYNANGTLDKTFGNNGITTSHFGNNENLIDIALTAVRLLVYGSVAYHSNDIIAAYKLIATCTPPTFKNDPTIVLAASCANNDGNISIIPTSGTAPFMYSKDGGATYVAGSDSGSGFQGLSAGVYKLRLKDANGCESAIVEKEVKLNCPTACTPPTFKNDLTIVLAASCANNDGNISIIPTSGTAPFMYSKDGGATYVAGSDSGSGFQGLSAGVYKLRLKDANGCESAIVEKEVKLNCATACTPPTFKNDLTIVLDASCANNDGNISIIPTSGTAPFMYSKDGGATYVSGSDLGSGFQGLSAGVYKLRLKDAKGCESAIVEKEVKGASNCPPTITSFSPTSGPVGTTVTIAGSNFDPVATNNTVYFGAVKATVTAATSNLLTVIVPLRATNQPITVTANGLSGYSRRPFALTFPGSCSFNNLFAYEISGPLFESKPRYLVNVPKGGGPYLGDFDGDGKPEVVTVTSDSIFLFNVNNKDGAIAYTLRAAFQTSSAASPSLSTAQNITIGDLDSDGLLDLAVGWVDYDSKSAGSLLILRNTTTNGVISFAPQVVHEQLSPTSISTKDLDGDGKPDLVVQNLANSSEVVSILRNISVPGTIAFTFINLPEVVNSFSFIGDMDGDGKPDIAGVRGNLVYVLRNVSTMGNISFAQKVTYPISSGLSVIADLDGDGMPDVAVANEYSKTVSIFKNISTSGTVAFQYQADFSGLFSQVSIGVGDLNGDGKPELVVGSSEPPEEGNFYDFEVLVNVSKDGSIVFMPNGGGTNTTPLRYVSIADFDGDGIADMSIGGRIYHSSLACPITCTPPTFKNDGTIVLDASCGNNDGNITIVPTSGSGPFMYSINGGSTYFAGADYGYTFGTLSAGTYQLRLKDAKGCESAIVERTVRNYYGCSGVIVASTSTDQLSLVANKEAISTYPNPSKGQFRLQLHNSISTKADISVINPEGRLIEKRIVQLVKTNTIDFDLTGRPKGMYYIKITSNNGTRTSKVLIQ